MSLQNRAASFRYAFKGIQDLFKSQANARIHLTVAMVVIASGIFFQISRTEWLSIAFCIGLVLSLEAINTAIEYLTDLVSPDFHPLAGKVKDMAAAAVLLAAMAAIVVGLLVFLPKFLS